MADGLLTYLSNVGISIGGVGEMVGQFLVDQSDLVAEAGEVRVMRREF